MLALKFLARATPFGLLALRVGLGLIFVIHGSGKLFGGPEVWEKLGAAMGVFGIHFYPIGWGLLAALSEFAGGILFILGFLFRPAALSLLITMIVAATMHIQGGDPFKVYSHALSLAVVFFGLLFVGPGKISLDRE